MVIDQATARLNASFVLVSSSSILGALLEEAPNNSAVELALEF